ncbi:MAG TPA: chromate transporter [Casimicrobiaceae bacterium]|jgi:chromate transporter|nr:chromate transporter [Casimicrobiaceae bacterium]
MHDELHALTEIAKHFSVLSLVAIGGINAILPEIHRVVVDIEGWMTSGEFVDLFAVAQLAPGPNAMIVALIGWKVAGIAGAIVATIAACGPSSVACYIAWHWADRLRDSPWRTIVSRALAPIAIGLILASGYTLARGADRSSGALALTLIATALLAWTRVNPVWVLLGAGAIGLAGFA